MEDHQAFLQTVRACRICVERPYVAPLPHEPRPILQLNPSARLLIAGQAPGNRAHESGLPFDDRSGDRLRDWMGVDRRLFYDESRLAIVPMGFCFPGYTRDGADAPPRIECEHHWRDKAMAMLPNLELIVCVGRAAMHYHMPYHFLSTVTETVRHWREPFETMTPPVLPVPHPSWRNNDWLNQNKWFEEDVVPVLRAEVTRLTG